MFPPHPHRLSSVRRQCTARPPKRCGSLWQLTSVSLDVTVVSGDTGARQQHRHLAAGIKVETCRWEPVSCQAPGKVHVALQAPFRARNKMWGERTAPRTVRSSVLVNWLICHDKIPGHVAPVFVRLALGKEGWRNTPNPKTIFSVSYKSSMLSWGRYCTQRKKKITSRNFPDVPVVKNPPANAGDTSSIPGSRTKIIHLHPCHASVMPKSKEVIIV